MNKPEDLVKIIEEEEKVEVEEEEKVEVEEEEKVEVEEEEKVEVEEENKHKLDKIYIINLEEKAERWKKISSRIEEENCSKPVQPFIGINGSKLNTNQIRNDVSKLSGRFFMTNEMYGKAKSHYGLWKSIINENENKKTDKDWFLILEDDAIIPNELNKYISELETFLNSMPEDIIHKTDMFNLSPIGDYGGKNDFHNKIMSLLTSIGSMIMGGKRKSNNKELYNLSREGGNQWSLLNSNFPLCTHSYLVNIKQLKNLVKVIDRTKIYYHLDWQLNLENVNINSILPIGIKRGGYDDSTSSTLTNPSIPIQILTMFNKKLACDLGKPVVNIMGMYQLNILIIVYALLMIIWQFLDIPGRLNDFFSNIGNK
jgi:GR25 family glycosyltransferase involved in LPS biosynthesis